MAPKWYNLQHISIHTLITICTVYEDGKVCISILHPPGTDVFNELEKAEERWRPILSVEAIIVSVMSMLSAPNDESPANIDAAVSASGLLRIFN